MIWYVGNPWDSSNSLSQGIPLGRCEGDCTLFVIATTNLS